MSTKYPGNIVTSGAPAGYSVAFDGTGDYLSEAYNAWMNFGTADFTVECWVYPISLASASAPFNFSATSTSVNSDVGWTIYVGANNSGNEAGFYSGSTKYAVTGWSLTANQWQHIALVRGSGSLKFYINGTQVGSTVSANVSVNSNAAWEFRIGNYSNNSTRYWNGYISNFRAVPGTAVYTSTFTPPTQLLNITNTSLLTCNSPAIVDQSSNAFAITANGNAAVSTFTPFQGTQLVPNPYTLANTQGVWSISDAAYWMSQNKWPMPPNYPLQSLRFNSADSAYLNRTPGSAGNGQRFTISTWLKKCKNDTYGVVYSAYSGAANTDSTIFLLYVDQANSTIGIGGAVANVSTTAVFRDPSAWYHLVAVVDTTQSGATNQMKIYINGVLQTVSGTAYSLSTTTPVNQAVAQNIGRRGSVPDRYFDGYLADTILVDGQALTPSSFGANDPNTGVWSPVPYSGSYGTNGFRLSFQDNTGTTATTLGKDWSGQGNNWTPNNFSVAAGSGNDSLTDGPTNWGIDYGNGGEVRGNYATFNPLALNGTLANGNLDGSFSASTTATQQTYGTLGVSSGKWYFEFTQNSAAGGSILVGVQKITASPTVANYTNGNYWSYYLLNGNKNNTAATAYGPTAASGDVIGCAIDMDAGNIWFSKNGVWMASGNPATGANPAYSNLAGNTVTPSVADDQSNAAKTFSFNAGQRPFAYTAPSGFKALCTTNLPIPTVGATSTTQANKYFDATLYTGTGSALSVTNAGSFQPDLVWYKDRSAASSNALFDAIRGVTAYLSSDSAAAEQTISGVTAFNSNGFSLGTNAGGNTNGRLYVGWQWNAGNSSVSNTAGSITSTVRANTAAGFSVVTYTGTGANATVGHGLGVAPKFIIVKNRTNGTRDWECWHTGLTSAAYRIRLNSSAIESSVATMWNSTAPTSTVFSIGTDNDVNQSTNNMVAYCFAEIAGFSKFGSYTGNGSADGPFVYCGFRPRWILVKRTDAGPYNWRLTDTARSTYNQTIGMLEPSSSAAEYTDAGNSDFDILSNGFKVRNTTAGLNGSSGTFIFMAFAESPFNYSRAR